VKRVALLFLVLVQLMGLADGSFIGKAVSFFPTPSAKNPVTFSDDWTVSSQGDFYHKIARKCKGIALSWRCQAKS
jgi:hypothetical protein